MNKLSKAKRLLLRLLGVILTAMACLSMGTAMPLPEIPAKNSAVVAEVSFKATPPEIVSFSAPEVEPGVFELTFIGDNTLASTEYNKALGVSYESVVGDDYGYPFSLTIDYFKDDDFTFANLECVLTSVAAANNKNFTFRSDPAYVNILTEGSVEFVTMGNNHVMDYGEAGYAKMISVLDSAGIGYAGRDEWQIYETESGLKIGVYALSFGTEAQVKAGIAAVRAAGAEFVIAAMHWGYEGSYQVDDKLQRQMGYAAIDAGADFVYGSHPHTLQPYEEYNGKYIYYSMGNWSFGGNTAPRDPDTIILKLTVERAADGTVSVTKREHIPCACTGTAGNDYRPVPYAEGSEEYLRTLSKIEGTFTGADLTVSYEYNFNEY